MLLQGITSRWSDYRRALRHHEQQHFDQLFEHAEAHADAAGYLNPDDPMDAILLSMLLEHEKRLHELETTDDSTSEEPEAESDAVQD